MYDLSPNIHQASRPCLSSDAIARSTDFWLTDGSIVLQAENMQFRIHLGLLSMNSPFFKDLSRLPQPADQPTVDGCAIVIVQDSSKDWENLLKWLYQPTRIVSEDFPLDILTSMLRLAKKYELDDVKSFVVAYLKNHIPTTIESWVSMESFWETWVHGKEVELVNLAEEFGMQTLLPALYCQCILAIGIQSFDLYNEEMLSNSITSRLLSRSQQILLAATSRIHGYNSFDLLSLLKGAAECPSVVACSNWRICILKIHLRYQEYRDLCFALFPALEEEEKYQRGLCSLCHKIAAEGRDRGWRDMWFLLPRIFGMQKDWEDLVDFEE